MSPEEIIERKTELEEELNKLLEEYLSQVTPCVNESCAFYGRNLSNGCSWSWWVTECRDYIGKVLDTQ